MEIKSRSFLKSNAFRQAAAVGLRAGGAFTALVSKIFSGLPDGAAESAAFGTGANALNIASDDYNSKANMTKGLEKVFKVFGDASRAFGAVIRRRDLSEEGLLQWEA